MKHEAIQSPPFYFIVVVWGDEYVDMLLRISLRCFLSPNNIPHLARLSVSKFIFVTTQADYLKIAQSDIFKTLSTYLEPIFIELTIEKDETIYSNMTVGYELATKLVYEHKAYAIYLLPDCIISDGSFLRLEKYADEGRDVVLVPGPRIIKEKFMSYVQDLSLNADDPLCFEPRALAAIGLSYLHKEYRHYQYVGSGFTKWPHIVTWGIPGQNGLLIRAFHLHPLMVNCSNKREPLSFQKVDTIDAHFIKRNFQDLNAFLLERDSDNIILFSMTNEKDRIENGLLWGEQEKLDAILEISQSNLVNELQKIYFYNTYKLHDSDLGSAWADIENESFAVVRSVLMPSSFIKNKNSLYKKIRSRVLQALPLILSVFLRKIYWRIRGAFSFCKAKLRALVFG